MIEIHVLVLFMYLLAAALFGATFGMLSGRSRR